MLALADVMYLLANELARLRARRLSFALVLTRAFERLSFRHLSSASVTDQVGTSHMAFYLVLRRAVLSRTGQELCSYVLVPRVTGENVSSFNLNEAASLLERDVVHTVGARYRGIVHDTAANVTTLGIATRIEKLVNDVQQYLNDALVDASWPPCPRHPAHALTYRDGAWWCDRDAVPVAALGDLPPTS